MNSRIINLFYVLALSLLVASCSSTKKLVYLQTLDNNVGKSVVKNNSEGLYEARFKPKDLLSISVVTSEPNVSKNYNLLVPQLMERVNNNLYNMPTMQSYLVDNEGNIDFPILGKIHIAGLTRSELDNYIQKRIGDSFTNERPIITIRITNYSVYVLGEVTRPGRTETLNDRITLFEALTIAEDLTVYGRRDNVKVLRENPDGTKTIITVNLNDKNIINSPAFNLEQNDIVYVEPNKAKARTSNIGSAESLTVSAFSILISVASLLVNIFM